ncbi:MAG TPA: pyridoxamine 5'-phosphate oxidase family protein [Chitinophagaceae bacterium]|nr:pyridoxamine 5'-phosphate oxidase family protein [Chitinophagaceae bacterium]
MGKFSEQIETSHREFIARQHMFFTGTAPLGEHAHVNISPKGLDSFRILSEHRVAYMDLIGSGNETSAHLQENGRITLMFCSFEKVPNILRLYGKGFVVTRKHALWDELSGHFPIYESSRQLIVADIHLVQTSCGYGVPLYEYQGERSIHFDWAERKGKEGLERYMQEKNTISLDRLSIDL